MNEKHKNKHRVVKYLKKKKILSNQNFAIK